MMEVVEVPIQKVTTSRREISSRCSKLIMEIFLPVNLPESFILGFQNHYTGIVTIEQDCPDGCKILVENYKLMMNPYCENEAQDWHFIHSQDFRQCFFPAKPLKLTLIQLANCWTKFEIKNIKIFIHAPRQESKFGMVSNRLDQLSINAAITSDLNLITESVLAQSRLKDIPDLSYTSMEEFRRTGKKPAKRKEGKNRTTVTNSQQQIEVQSGKF
jgi:hypothetical protein